MKNVKPKAGKSRQSIWMERMFTGALTILPMIYAVGTSQMLSNAMCSDEDNSIKMQIMSLILQLRRRRIKQYNRGIIFSMMSSRS